MATTRGYITGGRFGAAGQRGLPHIIITTGQTLRQTGYGRDFTEMPAMICCPVTSIIEIEASNNVV